MPLYASALEKSLPRVVSRADSVLEGVKRRGRQQGDIMDAATEEVLKPQVRTKEGTDPEVVAAGVEVRVVPSTPGPLPFPPNIVSDGTGWLTDFSTGWTFRNFRIDQPVFSLAFFSRPEFVLT